MRNYKKNYKFFFDKFSYLVKLYFSLCLHWVRLGIYYFQSYFDYLEIMRFRLWNSIQADKNVDASEAYGNSIDKISRRSTWVVRPVFTKIIDWFSNFSPVRGFGWDFGSNTQSIEADLRQKEHSFGLENFYVYGRVQRLFSTDHPKRFSWHYLNAQNNEDYQNVDYLFSKLIKNIRSVSYVIYSFISIFFFSLFILTDTVYLLICWFIFKIFYKFQINPYGIFPFYVFNTIVGIFSPLFTLIFKFLFLFIRPLVYFAYICSVVFFSIVIFIKNITILVYLIFSKYLFNFFFYFYKNWKFKAFKISKIKGYTYIYIRWFFYLPIRAYSYIIEKWSDLFCYLAKDHKVILFFLRLVTEFFALFIRSILLLLFFWYTWKPLLWFAHYFVGDVICVEYYGLIGPAVISVISILSLAWLIPFMRKLVKISRSVRLMDRELEYEDGKYLSDFTIQFYKGLNKNTRINRVLRKWPMGREVISVQLMNETETTGLSSTQDFGKEYTGIKEKLYEEKNYRISQLTKYFSERLDINQNFNAVTKKLDRESTEEDKKFFETAKRDKTFKFRSKEFKITQFDLLQFYQHFPYWKEANSIVARSVYNYQCLYPAFGEALVYEKKKFTSFFYNFSADYQSSFIFRNNSFNLQILKISEFSKIFKRSKYFFQISSEFPARNSLPYFERLDWDKGEYLSKLESPAYTKWNWENSLISQNQNWMYLLPRNMKQNSGFENSRDLFWSNSVIDDKYFHSILHTYKHIFLYNRKTYNRMVQRIQIAYDFYWSFRINANAFFTYTFGTDFYFASTYSIIPNWLFKNSLFTPTLTYPVYQDNLATLFTHAWNINSSFEIADTIAFSKILNMLATAGNVTNGLKILNNFYDVVRFQGSYVDSKKDETFSTDFIDWRANTFINKSIRHKKSIDDSIKFYLGTELALIEPEIFSFSEALYKSHKQDSAFTTYLYERTSSVLTRYIIGEREKRIGIFADLAGLFRVVVKETIKEDEQLVKVLKDIEFIETIEKYDKKTHEQLLRVRITSRCFPVIDANIIWQFFIMFNVVSYLHLVLLEDFQTYQNSKLQWVTKETIAFSFEVLEKAIMLFF